MTLSPEARAAIIEVAQETRRRQPDYVPDKAIVEALQASWNGDDTLLVGDVVEAGAVASEALAAMREEPRPLAERWGEDDL